MNSIDISKKTNIHNNIMTFFVVLIIAIGFVTTLIIFKSVFFVEESKSIKETTNDDTALQNITEYFPITPTASIEKLNDDKSLQANWTKRKIPYYSFADNSDMPDKVLEVLTPSDAEIEVIKGDMQRKIIIKNGEFEINYNWPYEIEAASNYASVEKIGIGTYSPNNIYRVTLTKNKPISLAYTDHVEYNEECGVYSDFMVEPPCGFSTVDSPDGSDYFMATCISSSFETCDAIVLSTQILSKIE